MAQKEKTFGQVVLGRAWWSSWRFFEDVWNDLRVGAVAILLTIYQHYQAHGFSVSLEDGWSAVVTFLIPFVAVWALLFVWHLWLAPAALAYEAAKEASEAAKARPTPPAQRNNEPQAPTHKPINWSIWKQMDTYSVRQFAAILANEDPASGISSTETSAFLKIIRDDIDAGRLPYIKEYGISFEGRRFEKSVNNDTEIKKAHAIAWADAHDNFNVSRVR